MGRKRIDINKRKEKITIRLPKNIILKIENIGTKQNVIETILNDNIDDYIDKLSKTPPKGS